MNGDPLTAAWLSEMWPVCREESRLLRIDKRKADRREQREMEDRRLAAGLPHVVDTASPESPGMSTGCAETGAEELSADPRECA